MRLIWPIKHHHSTWLYVDFTSIFMMRWWPTIWFGEVTLTCTLTCVSHANIMNKRVSLGHFYCTLSRRMQKHSTWKHNVLGHGNFGCGGTKKSPPINSLCLMERGCGTHLITFPVASALCVTWGVSCPSLADSYFSQQQKKREAPSHLICRSLMWSQGDTSKEADILK